MKPYEAWLYAASWGSYMTNGDPGACMYGFSEDCRPQSERHRADCLAWIDTECLPAVRENPQGFDDDEESKLLDLRAYLAGAPVTEV